ncbi:hypothetical protein PIB30_043914 [Stylosanthes scabra]|uniref:Reverse transcriptase zinc-binding domain-containing protein n=1 Tax=Stylosanthes scabra TaxID=79078 RepID=A0ABU6UHJ2_9FABA|nr:hypothetical protein [Stylosanthes scabra]
MAILGKVSLKLGESDVISWRHDSSGVYSVNTLLHVFYDKHGNEGDEDIKKVSKLIWRSLVLPKVDLLVWMVSLEKLNTRDKLVSCWLFNTSMVNCPLCEKEPEKNACRAKSPPPVQPSSTLKLVAHATNISPSRQDGPEQSVTNFQSQNRNAPIWSNGVLLVSPSKVRSGILDRKLKDRPCPLGPKGKVDSLSHQSTTSEDNGSKDEMENGTLSQCDYQRSIQHFQAVVELPKTEIGDAIHRPDEKIKNTQ